MADRDYLAARICWRTRLPEQFLWAALQAIEKALKTILLYNDASVRDLGHDIESALTRAIGISALQLDPPKDVRAFIGYLNRSGQNRYLERGFRLRGTELVALDKAYWHLRRYCQNLRAEARQLKMSEAEWLNGYAKHFRDKRHLARPYRFRLFLGHLEDVLAGKHGSEQYSALVWKNAFFGKRDKGNFSIRPLRWSANPAHFRYPEVFDELARIVYFPMDVQRALSRTGKRRGA